MGGAGSAVDMQGGEEREAPRKCGRLFESGGERESSLHTFNDLMRIQLQCFPERRPPSHPAPDICVPLIIHQQDTQFRHSCA